ncbi:MAG: response regulator [Phototrophicaceae bacterium]
MTLTIVLIAETSSKFINSLQKNYTSYIVRSGKQAIKLAKEHHADIIILDAISLGTNGERICKRLREAFPEKPIIHLYSGKKITVNSPADTILCRPVTVRTLLSSINLLTSKQEMMLLRQGDFALDLERRILMVRENEIALTPKQSSLVEAFLRHPNEILDRKWLMRHIWDTDYTGDTRTLSVHVRFVREAMEQDASKPQFIKTVRGIGYRFEIALNEKTDL